MTIVKRKLFTSNTVCLNDSTHKSYTIKSILVSKNVTVLFDTDKILKSIKRYIRIIDYKLTRTHNKIDRYIDRTCQKICSQ